MVDITIYDTDGYTILMSYTQIIDIKPNYLITPSVKPIPINQNEVAIYDIEFTNTLAIPSGKS